MTLKVLFNALRVGCFITTLGCFYLVWHSTIILPLMWPIWDATQKSVHLIIQGGILLVGWGFTALMLDRSIRRPPKTFA